MPNLLFFLRIFYINKIIKGQLFEKNNYDSDLNLHISYE